jgi:hypothetical protein
MSGVSNQLQDFGPELMKVRHHSNKLGGIMKKLFALAVLSICMAAPSFANDVVGHSVKVAGKDSGKAVAVAGKDSGKAVAVAGKDTAKATVKVMKVLF